MPPGPLLHPGKNTKDRKMKNIHVGEVPRRDRPKADADCMWNSLPKVNLDLDDIFLHYEEKKVCFIKNTKDNDDTLRKRGSPVVD